MRSVLAAGILALAVSFAAPAVAKPGKTEQLAACMWSKMPTTTAAFAPSQRGMQEFSLFMKAAAECDPPAGNMNLLNLKKRLQATRPLTVGPDQGTGEGAFVCPRGADGAVQSCKAAGE